MLKITKVIALILCISLTSVFAQEEKFLEGKMIEKFEPKHAEEFISGYFAGIELFNDIARNSTCIQDSETIIEDAFKLWNILKDLKIDVHIISNVKEIVLAVQEIVSHLKTEDDQCKAAADLALNDIHRVIERVGRDGYIKELGSHTWKNVGPIEEMIKDGYSAFHGGNMQEAGLNFGKATKFIGFWDL